ncbi:MAG TPA: sensor histidine kinase [Streptosporangiaceae bacterium]|nr:sensor histidine kinase [Streptosporangiaceae bacterium]
MDPLLIDGIAAFIVFALMAGQFIGTRHLLPGQHPTTVLTWLLAILIVAPILTHRRFPRVSVAVCLTAVAVYALGRYVAYPGLAIFVLTFDIALHSKERIALATLFASAAVIWVSVSLQPGTVAVFATYVESELGILVAWLIGRNLRHRRARWAELQSRAERLEREREEEARRAVTEERLRIARELHDAIAHSMSVIAVQSAVGNHVMDTQPAEARQALAAIEATSRSALTEMRRLLGVLRQEGEPRGSLVPAPGLSDLASLVGQVQDAGLRVWINVDGQRGQVPPGIDLSAYRIIQEALTNVIKHAAASCANVTVSYRPDSVTVEITDQGPRVPGAPQVPPARAGSGHGIIGMRERVAVFGGEFAAGPRPDGGFRVRACFPIAEVTR